MGVYVDALSQLLTTFRLKTDLINNAQFCGDWAVDTSGTGKASFHVVAHAQCYLRTSETAEPTMLEKGDFVLFPRDSKHLLSNVADTDVAINQQVAIPYEQGLQEDGVGLICGYFHFKQKAAHSLTDVLPDAIVIRNRDASSNLSALINIMIDESLNLTPGVEVTIDRLAEGLFVIILREHIQNSDAPKGIVAALRDPRVYKVLEALHAQSEKKWTVDKMASIAAMSRSSFAERFKSLLEESPMEYLTRWRMQLAYNLLDEQGLGILDVAYRCGYESEAAFAKAFKRVIGTGPGAVRQQVSVS